MSDGVFRRFVADQVAIGIVVVTCDYVALCIHDGHYIALKVGDVIVERAIVLQCIGVSARIVEEVQGVAAKAFPQQFTTGIIVSVLGAIDRKRITYVLWKRYMNQLKATILAQISILCQVCFALLIGILFD